MNAAVPERLRISADLFEQMISTGVLDRYDRIELIEGDMISEPGPNPPHSAVVARATKLLILSVGESAMVSPGGSLRLGNFSIPLPDLMLVKPRKDFYATRRPAVSEVLLLVEISDSSLAYDRGTKCALYARHGIAEYWVVDVNRKRLYMYRDPGTEGYVRVLDVGPADTVSPRALPALQLPVGKFFS